MKPASQIHLLERDYFLGLHQSDENWPPDKLGLINDAKLRDHAAGTRAQERWWATDWQPHREEGGHLSREITRGEEEQPSFKGMSNLREVILRFPSAPLFGSQSNTEHQVRLPPIHQHTLRLLTSAHRPDGSQIKKLFLILNGLNELDDLGFYYDLAALLIANPDVDHDDTGCLIVPFPAHLTRYPMIGTYAEKPLQRFITDPSDLFRQYLRFMVEMQWLMSVLVPVSYYPVTSGIPLLGEDTNPNFGRCDSSQLSTLIYGAWRAIFEYTSQRGPAVAEVDILQSIVALRHLIGWSASATALTERSVAEPLDPPQVHVIGYSLGGYLAQSAFFTWPYAICSCATLCSGGALHGLRPEKIIHAEEWRAITHGLKYDIDSGILERRIDTDKHADDPQFVCGIPVAYFAAHFQTFNDIFLQDEQGSYRHRVAEFAPRMFFVIGGNDPIVPTRAVLDTSPPEGINMIEIANLTHFIARDGGEWPAFWLPTIAGIISSLSGHSETLLRTTMLANLWNDETTGCAGGKTWPNEGRADERPGNTRRESAQPESLDSEETQKAVSGLVKLLEDNGYLIVLRNQIPITLMGPRVLHRRGTVPHYAEPAVRRFWQRLQDQRKSMRDRAQRVTIVIPARLGEWFLRKPPMLSFEHLSVVRELPYADQQKEIWTDFLKEWENAEGALYRFDPQQEVALNDSRFRLERLIRTETATPDDHWVLNCLPDIWIGVSQNAARDLTGTIPSRDSILEKLGERMPLIYSGSAKKDAQCLTEPEKGARKDLEDWLNNDEIQILRISSAHSSPRFLGERVRKWKTVVDLLTHTALALARSKPCNEAGDFERH